MITENEIKHLEDLSKLQFTDEERKKFQQEFGSIVEFASQITGAKVEDKSFIKTIKMEDLRDDIVQPSLSQDEVVSNAPVKKKGCFSVPRIME